MVVGPAAALAAEREKPQSPIDIRGKLHDFQRDTGKLLNEFEDAFILKNRTFEDQLRATYRTAEQAVRDDIATADDWKKAQRDGREKFRKLETDMRQQVRLRREEGELEFLRFQKTREDELKSFFEGLENDILEYRKDPGYSQARSDLSEGKSELRDNLSKFRERIRSHRPADRAWE